MAVPVYDAFDRTVRSAKEAEKEALVRKVIAQFDRGMITIDELGFKVLEVSEQIDREWEARSL